MRDRPGSILLVAVLLAFAGGACGGDSTDGRTDDAAVVADTGDQEAGAQDLPETTDPAVADPGSPDATEVVDAEGIDLAGNSIGRATAFTIAAAFDPLAPDPAKERERLARKADEGAHLLYTQPIFVRKALDEAVEAASRHRLPLVFGLLPLRSSRHSEFMHNEVPGIVIPDEIRTRIAGMADDDARQYGLDVARQFLLDARPITQGVYLMPPFGNHKIAESVLKVLDHPG